MWSHFFAEETSAKGLADAMLDFQRRFDWDFMKVNPRASYQVEDWGVAMSYPRGGTPRVLTVPVTGPEDWRRLEVLPPDQAALGEHLRALETIADGLKGEVPFLMTVFTPLSVASRLAPSEDLFMTHLREYPERVEYALEVVTETFNRFSSACLDRGAGGLFFATTSWATRDRMTDDEYSRFGRAYDLKLLQALPEAEFHVLHVCRENNMLDMLADYPVRAFNWDVHGFGNTSLAEGKELVGTRAVIGGVDHGERLVRATPQELAEQLRDVSRAMGNRGWMLGTGCTFRPETPEANVRAVREAVGAGPDG